MARKRRSGGTIVTLGKDTARRLAPTVPGRPGFTETGGQRRLGTIRPFKARSVRTLLKKDIAKGVTQPEFKTASADVGQITPQTRSVVMHETPQIPVRSGTGRRVVAAPSPTSGAGVRNPFNVKRRVGRRGNNKRFGG
jgi:hypothetical protein